MAKGGNHNLYSEQWFLSRGYTKNPDGSFQPPKFRNLFTEPEKRTLHKNPPKFKGIFKEDILCDETPLNRSLIEKIKVNNSPDFEVTPKLEWFIPYQVPSKKNSQQLYIRKSNNGSQVPSTTTSQRYKDYISATKNYWEVFGNEFRNSIEKLKILPPYQIHFTFIRSTKQKVDYVGPLESCQDIMQDFKWIENDDAYTMKPHLGDIEVDKQNPGVRIKLLKHGI